MQIPGNMTCPRLRLEDGEEVSYQLPALRRKGVFGNRYGMLILTNKRLAFVKAIMRAGVIGAAASKMGARPMLAYDRAALRGAEKVQDKKMVALLIEADGKRDKFVVDGAAADELLARGR